MKIKRIEATGLNGNLSCSYDLYDDMNVVTGLNGSGKTTLLKIMWYLISGNAERIGPEVSFQTIVLTTDLYVITMKRDEDFIDWTYSSANESDEGRYGIGSDDRSGDDGEKINHYVISHQTQSFYFPTFRRIEGGYSMASGRRVRRRVGPNRFVTEMYMPDEIQTDLESVANRLSVQKHRFICSISTHDIAILLTKTYANVSEELNNNYKDFSTSIIDAIRGAKIKSSEGDESQSMAILDDIHKRADAINEKREELLKPFALLSELTARLFRHKGIRVKAVTLGESVDAIDSGALSAGEKQMLSFLCYNAFARDSVIFIDEPELSLHPDWQRKLFGILTKQQPTNQFIVATHSPFIYSKYEDKEIALGVERGE